MTKDEEIVSLREQVSILQELLAAPCPEGEFRIDLRIINDKGESNHLARLYYPDQLDNGMKRRAELIDLMQTIEDKVFGSPIIRIQ